jgi:hypothetical protein
MTITASGRSALILAAGLWLCVAGPMRATESDARPADSSTNADSATDKPIALNKFAKPRHARKTAKSTKSDKADKAAATTSAEADARTSTEPMPAAVANANAQLPADAPAETTASVAAKADSVFKGIGGAADVAAPSADARTQVVAADQLNELDRAISDDKAQGKVHETANDKPALTLASATIDAPVVVSQSNSATLDQTSLIGKIFIAFGGLLTLASAARMFIA